MKRKPIGKSKIVGFRMILTHHFDALMFYPKKTASDRISREHFKMIDHFSCDSENKHRQEITSRTGNQNEETL